jgi:SAM-dependent methyltransferase
MIRKAVTIFKRRGLRVLARAAFMRMRGMMASQAKSFQAYEHFFREKSGIEIGGPSAVFARRGIFPVYSAVGSLDNINFSNTTAWSADHPNSNASFEYDGEKQAGVQYLGEATSLSAQDTGAYDFVLSSHMLEHTANPIKALTEWKRLLKEHGILVLIVPNKKFTFDHRRPVTTIEHLISDFEADMEEDDLTHLPEILAAHDFQRDPDAPDAIEFKNRCLRNAENRCMHHHVFDAQLLIDLIQHLELSVRGTEEIAPHHLFVLAQKA